MVKDKELANLRNLLAFGEESIRLFKDIGSKYRALGSRSSVNFFELHLGYWRMQTGEIRSRIFELENLSK